MLSGLVRASVSVSAFRVVLLLPVRTQEFLSWFFSRYRYRRAEGAKPLGSRTLFSSLSVPSFRLFSSFRNLSPSLSQSLISLSSVSLVFFPSHLSLSVGVVAVQYSKGEYGYDLSAACGTCLCSVLGPCSVRTVAGSDVRPLRKTCFLILSF